MVAIVLKARKAKTTIKYARGMHRKPTPCHLISLSPNFADGDGKWANRSMLFSRKNYAQGTQMVSQQPASSSSLYGKYLRDYSKRLQSVSAAACSDGFL
jgi:hypothetical protein